VDRPVALNLLDHAGLLGKAVPVVNLRRSKNARQLLRKAGVWPYGVVRASLAAGFSAVQPALSFLLIKNPIVVTALYYFKTPYFGGWQ
jgi:hypothetical protein